MAKCDNCYFDPCQCCCDEFTMPSEDGMGSLVSSLGPCVDQLRDLEVCLGARNKIVRLIWTQWSGGKRGHGVETKIREIPIMPLPEVSETTALRLELQNVGTAEVGQLKVSKISTRYTSNFLMGLSQDGKQVPKDQNFYWEIEEPDASLHPRKRRFIPVSPPDLNELNFEWTINLVKASEDRAPRTGALRN